MKLKFILLSLAASCGLPALSLAQGTYLRAPDGNPTNALVVAPGGFIGIGATPWSGAKLLIDVGDYGDAIALWSPTHHHWRMGPQTGSGTGFGIHDDTRDQTPFTIDANGNIGIGTPYPQSTLDVAGNIHCTGNIGIGTAGPDAQLDVWGGGDTSSVLDVVKAAGPSESPVFRVFKNNPKQDNTLSLTVLRTGDVGIGVAAPQARLDVAGNIRCTVIDLTSDRNAKTGFVPVDGRSVLERVALLPITTWQYTNAPGVKHLGPMAQDFQAAFSLGSDDKHIASVDADGVALASIQALYQELQQRDKQLKEKESRLAALEAQFRHLEQQLAGLSCLTPEREREVRANHAATASSTSVGDAR